MEEFHIPASSVIVSQQADDIPMEEERDFLSFATGKYFLFIITHM